MILISNTSQTVAEFKLRTLKKIKLKFIYFDKIITAGEALINIVRKSKNDPISKIVSSKQSYIISNGNEKKIINKLKIINTDYTQCRFILAMSLKPKKNLFNILSKIKKLAKRKIPMVCTNPDIYTFKKKKRYYQIGYIAKKYKSLGGKVFYIGKPYMNIFKNLLRENEKKKAIIIGDNLETDILGGKKLGIKTALAFDGFKKINKHKSKKSALKKIFLSKIKPNYLIKDISII